MNGQVLSWWCVVCLVIIISCGSFIEFQQNAHVHASIPMPYMVKNVIGFYPIDGDANVNQNDGTSSFSVSLITKTPNGTIFFLDREKVRIYDPITMKVNTWRGLTSSQVACMFYRTNGEVYVMLTGVITKIKRNGDFKNVAGTGSSGYTDTKIALTSRISPIFNSRYGQMIVSSNGDIVFADTSNHIIRRVIASTGEMKTIAGIRSAGFLGDGGLATAAKFNSPTGIAVSKIGEIYIADSANHRIRKIMLNGNITTIAGNGTSGLDTETFAINAKLNIPTVLSFNSNDELVFIDYGNNLIRKIQPDGKIVTLLSGKLLGALAFGSQNETYFSSYNCLKKFVNGNETTLLSPGAERASVYNPVSFQISNKTCFFTQSSVLNRVELSATASASTLSYTTASKAIQSVGLDSSFENAQVLYSSDSTLNMYQKSTDTDTIIAGMETTQLGWQMKDDNVPALCSFMKPGQLFVTSSHVYIADQDQLIRIINKASNNVSIFDNVVGISKYYGLVGFGQIQNDKLLIVTDRKLVSLDLPGNNNLVNLGMEDNGGEPNPNFPSNDPVGTVRILGVNSTVSYIKTITSNPSGNITYLAKSGTSLNQLGLGSQFLKISGNEMVVLYNFAPYSNVVILSMAGNDDMFYFSTTAEYIQFGWLTTDEYSNILPFYFRTGYQPYSEGISLESLKLNTPPYLAVHPVTKELYLSDKCTIYRLTAERTVYKVTGEINSCVSNGDNGPASLATIRTVFGLSFYQDDLYISTDRNIRKINLQTNIITTIAGSESGCPATNMQISLNNFIYKYSNVYAVDSSGIVIKIENGIYSHIAGSGDTGIYSHIAGSGDTSSLGDENVPAKKANFINPIDLDVSKDGSILILDVPKYNSNTKRLRFLNSTTGYVRTIATLSSPTSAKMDSKGNVYIVDECYLKMIPSGSETVVTIAGTGSCSYITYPVYLNSYIGTKVDIKPSVISIDSDDQVYFLDSIGGYPNSIKLLEQTCPENSTFSQGDNTCICNEGYYGDFCSDYSCFNISRRNSSACSSNGLCIHPDVCQCAEQYYGINCNTTKCFGIASDNSLVCSGRGSCAETDYCACIDGWTGTVCDIPQCYGVDSTSPLACSSHGICVNSNNCSCYSDYYGKNCDTYNCYGYSNFNSSVCASHGKCNSPDQCQCNANYYGNDCSTYYCYGISVSNSSVCSGNGKCVAYNNCTCSSGYYGNSCNLTKCFGIPHTYASACSSHGQCIAYDKCQCASGYYGSNCASYDCYGYSSLNSSVCSTHGKCNSPDECQCNANYYSNDCSNYYCNGISVSNSSVCSGHGKCTSYNDCKCFSGYDGSNCDLFMCFGVPRTYATACSSRGQCIDKDKCQCSQGYYGNNCELYDCYGYLYLNASVCSSHGNCSTPNSCQCNTNFYGNDCSNYNCYGISFTNTSSVCSGNGKCVAYNNCTCSSGYYGSTCNLTTCFGIPHTNSSACSSHGQCIANDKCQCASGYYGNNCALFDCFGVSSLNKTTCGGNGICSSPNTCQCVSGWKGNSQCSQFSCENRNNCNGNGVCSGNNTCSCNSGWSQSNCSVFTCVNNCFGNGKCISNNTCNCTTGWIGSQCNISTCYGLSQENVQVCSGNGYCKTPNNCTCNLGYLGQNCSQFTCFGILNSSTACSGNGICLSYNKCNCSSGYSNQDCSEFSCNGISRSNKTVCSSHGKCLKYNSCQCDSGYNGTDCSNYQCYGVGRGLSNVCSGKGKCTSLDTCLCDQDYYGTNCQFSNITCFGIPSNNYTTVCSGRGVCLKRDVCNCSQLLHAKVGGLKCDNVTCDTDYYGKTCGQYCNPVVSCRSHGSCSVNGTCTCYSSSTLGFWRYDNCSTCQENYYGEKCLTYFSSSAVKFNSNGRSLTISTINYNANSQIQSCSNLFRQASILGINPTCVFNGTEIIVTLGTGSTVLPRTNIEINVRVFESAITEYVSFQIVQPTYTPAPIPILSYNSSFEACENVLVDASSSYCDVANTLLYFNWTISPPVSFNNSGSKLNIESVPSGNYTISLVVSSVFNQSKMITFTISKKAPIPTIEIAESDHFSGISLSQVPYQVNNMIMYPGCSVTDKVKPEYVKIEWVQLQGNSTYSVVSNNLVINSFQSFHASQYIFKVTLTYMNTFISTATVTIDTKDPDFGIVLYQSDLNVTHVTLNVDIDPVDVASLISSTPRIWNCKDELVNCDHDIISQLMRTPGSPSITIAKSSLSTIDLSLQISNKISYISITFPEPNQVIPVINLLSVSPQRTELNIDEILSIQVLISLDGKFDGIDNEITISWVLSSSSGSKAVSSASMLNLDMSQLITGLQYTLTCTVTSLASRKQAVYTYSFIVSSPPPKCVCTISPSSGFALETKFTFTCPQSCVTGSTTLKFSFKDSSLNAILPLYEGTKVSFVTSLPYTGIPSLDIYFTVRNTITNAKTDNIITWPVLLPKASSLVEWKKKTVTWTNTYQSLAIGDPQKIVYSYTQKISDAMKKLLRRRDLSDVSCQNGGVYNEDYQMCVCPYGFKKSNCQMTLSDWEEYSSVRWEFQRLVYDEVKTRIDTDSLSENKLMIQIALLSNSLFEYDEIPNEMLDECLVVFDLLLQKTLQTSYLAPPSSQITLMSQMLNLAISTQRSLYGNDSSIFTEKISEFSKTIATLSTRSTLSGSISTVTNQLFSIVSSKFYPTDLSNKVLILNKLNEKVLFGSMMTRFIQNVNFRKPITAIVSKSSIPVTSSETFIQSDNSNSTITNIGINYILNTNFTNQKVIIPEKDQVISFSFYISQPANNSETKQVMGDSVLRTTTTSSFICKSDVPCLMEEESDSHYKTCKCSLPTFVTIQQVTNKTVTLEKLVAPEQSTTIPDKVTQSNQLAYLAFLLFIPVIAMVVIGIIYLVKTKRKAKPETPSHKSKELQSV